MSQFLGLLICPDKSNKVYYFDLKIRKKLSKNNLNYYNWDIHKEIADYFHLNEDKCNEYEYNPFTKIFTIDRQCSKINDSEKVESFIKNTDLSDIIESGTYNLDYDWKIIPEEFKFPQKLYGHLMLWNLRELPDNFELPKEIKGITFLPSLETYNHF